MAPESMPIENMSSIVGKAVSTVSLFACAPDLKAAALERQGMATCRYEMSGTRELLVMSFESLSDFVVKTNAEKATGQDFFDFYNEVMYTIATTEQLDVLESCGGIIHKAIVRPGQFMYIPAGHWTAERVLGEQSVFGFRTGNLDPHAQTLSGFQNLIRQYKSSDKAQEPLVNFWESLHEVSTKKGPG